jgi:hypothetical protein
VVVAELISWKASFLELQPAPSFIHFSSLGLASNHLRARYLPKMDPSERPVLPPVAWWGLLHVTSTPYLWKLPTRCS